MRLPLSEEQLERHHSFLRREPADRALVGHWLCGLQVPELYPRVAATIKPGVVAPEDISLEPLLDDVQALWEGYAAMEDDFAFAASVLLNVPWMEAIMGCPVNFSGTSFWASPCIGGWESYSWEQPTCANPWAEKLLELLEALVHRSNGRWTCSPTLMRGVADLCVAMRGPTNLLYDLYDCPTQVQRLAELCAAVWVDVGKAQLKLIPESENGYIISSLGLRCWSPQKGVWLQDDALCLLSPRFYSKIFLPYVRQVAGEFPFVAFHLHGNTLWSLDLLLDVDEIDVLELTYDLGATTLETQLIPAWQRIREVKPCQAVGFFSAAEFARVRAVVSPIGFSLQSISPTLADARALSKLLS